MRDALINASPGSQTAARSRAWPWAIACAALVLLLVAALVRARIGASRGPSIVPAPSLPPMAVVSVAHPEAGATRFALDAPLGHVVALAVPHESQCPPMGPCPPPPTPDTFVVLDGSDGQTLTSVPLTGDAAPAASATFLLADDLRHLAYAIAPHAIVIFSTQDGARQGGYGLPDDLPTGATGAALDAGGGILYLADARTVIALVASSGHVQARGRLPDGGAGAHADGPVYDAAHGRVYLLERYADAGVKPILAAFEANTLTQAGQSALPTGARLGPLDAAGGSLHAFGADGTTWRIPLTGGQIGTPAAIPALRNALALGENLTLGHRYIMDASATRVIGGATGAALAALPLPAQSSPTIALPVDVGRGLVYLLADHGTLVIARDGAPPSTSGGIANGPTAAAALLLARAAMATFHPTVGQDHPFLASSAFPLHIGTRAEGFWLRYAKIGWQGPYPGDTSARVTPLTSQAGAYRVTFTITWNQLFVQHHTWDCDVAPDGSVRLAAESGDAVP